MNAKLKTLLISISTLLVVGIAVLITSVFLIYKNQAAIHESNQKIHEEENRTTQAKKVSAALERSSVPVKLLKSFLVPDGEIVEVVKTLEGVGTKTGVDVTISALSAEDSSTLPIGSINKIKARIDGKGTWGSVLKFLTLLESLPHKIFISNISIRRVEDVESGKAPTWNISLQVEILKIK